MNNEKTGKFLKKLREEKNLSQNQLGEKTNISRSLINKIENGKSPLTLTNALFFCEFYGIEMSELIAGKRKNKDNKKDIDEAVYKVVGENNKLKKKLKYCAMTFVLLLLFLLLSFFINFYCSVKVYNIELSSPSIDLTTGLFFRTKDRVYFYLENEYSILEDDVSEVTLFYKLDDKRQDVVIQDNLKTIYFVDYNGYGEYVDFKKIDDIMKNMYLELTFTNGEVEEIKLDFSKDYVNNKIFGEMTNPISDDLGQENNIDDNPKSELFNKVQKVYEKYKDNDGVTRIKYNNKEYQISSMDGMLHMSFKEGKREYEFEYVGLYSEFFYFSEFQESSELREIYEMNYGAKKCQRGNCETYENDIKLFEKIVDLILERG